MIEFVYLTISNYLIGNLNTILGILFSLSLYRYTKVHYMNSDIDGPNTEKLMKYMKEDMKFMQSTITFEGDQEPYGYCFSWKKRYIAYVNQGSSSQNGKSKFTGIIFIGNLPDNIKKEESVVAEKKDIIKLYLARAYYNNIPQEVKLPFSGFNPRDKQLMIMNQIKDKYDESKFSICRALIYGKAGGGKSFIGKLLAKELDAQLCFDLRLDEPGTPLMSMWQFSSPEKNNPLIVQIDEFDVLIHKVHRGDLKNDHKWLRRMIYDKQSFNTFMSEYLNCLPYVIYVFTMNSNPSDINALDESYIRDNRMDLVLELN
jgi:hypothetical protein